MNEGLNAWAGTTSDNRIPKKRQSLEGGNGKPGILSR